MSLVTGTQRGPGDQTDLNILRRRFLTQAGTYVTLPVTLAATTLDVVFNQPMSTLTYGVLVSPNWNTTVWVTPKTATGCTVNFGTAAPANATVDVMTYSTEYS